MYGETRFSILLFIISLIVIVTLEPTCMIAWRSRNIGIGTLNTGRYRYSPVTPLSAGITGYPVTGTSLEETSRNMKGNAVSQQATVEVLAT
jgi:hypothetical protein